MRFEWDEVKRATNLLKHGVDFVLARKVFDDRGLVMIPDLRMDYGEPRYRAVGVVDGIHLFVAYTVRRGAIRVISVRKAHRLEREVYALHNRTPVT